MSSLKGRKGNEIDPSIPSTSRGLSEDIYGSNARYNLELLIIPTRRKRRKRTTHQVRMVSHRELGVPFRTSPDFRHHRELYTTVPLKQHLLLSDPARDLIVGWTPSGDRLITYGNNFRCVKIYRYLGIQHAKESNNQEQIFKDLFEHDHEVSIPRPDVLLRHDCVLFTDDTKHLVLCASQTAPEQGNALPQMFLTNEHMPVQGHALENYFFYVLDVEKGEICCEFPLTIDRISIAHGVSISGRYLVIVSHQHQFIHVFRIHPLSGVLQKLHQIGPSVHSDDNFYNIGERDLHSVSSPVLTGFKQRLYTFLYKRAKNESTRAVQEFLRKSIHWKNLRMDRTQVFDEYYILMRMLPYDLNKDSGTYPCFYVVFDWRDVSIIDIFDKYDERLLSFVENHSEQLIFNLINSCNGWPGLEQLSSISRLYLSRAKKRGNTDVRIMSDQIRRQVSQLPLASFQQFKISMQSPYMDPKLFVVEDRTHVQIVSGKIKLEGNSNLRIMSAILDNTAFNMPLKEYAANQPSALYSRQTVSLLFHPTDPFCVVVDRGRSDPNVLLFMPRKASQNEELKSEETDSTAGSSTRDAGSSPSYIDGR